MNEQDLKNQYQGNFRQLRKIINSWDLIPGAPTDEFDSLIHKILSHLYKGSDFSKIIRVLDSELTVNYGLSVNIESVDKIATDIVDWWNNNDVKLN